MSNQEPSKLKMNGILLTVLSWLAFLPGQLKASALDADLQKHLRVFFRFIPTTDIVNRLREQIRRSSEIPCDASEAGLIKIFRTRQCACRSNQDLERMRKIYARDLNSDSVHTAQGERV